MESPLDEIKEALREIMVELKRLNSIVNQQKETREDRLLRYQNEIINRLVEEGRLDELEKDFGIRHRPLGEG